MDVMFGGESDEIKRQKMMLIAFVVVVLIIAVGYYKRDELKAMLESKKDESKSTEKTA